MPIHGQLAIAVCTFGTLFNIANIVVLTHRDMRLNPINMILTGIAFADCLVMIEYIPFTIHMYLLQDWDRDQEEKVKHFVNQLIQKYRMISHLIQFSLAWSYFLLFHSNFSIMIHTVSIWLTLSLAIWRFVMIKLHSLAIEVCTIPKCRKLLIFAYCKETKSSSRY